MSPKELKVIQEQAKISRNFLFYLFITFFCLTLGFIMLFSFATFQREIFTYLLYLILWIPALIVLSFAFDSVNKDKKRKVEAIVFGKCVKEDSYLFYNLS